MPPSATTSGNPDKSDNANDSSQLYLSASYGLVDGFNTSSSTLRLVFDIAYNNTQLSLKALRAWMSTPTGIIISAIETLIITGFSLFSNLFPKSKQANPVSKFLVYSWELIRDVYKAFKNAYKGLRSLLQAINLNMFQIIIPTWLILGFFSGLNRIGYRRLKDERKQIIQTNDALRYDVMALNDAGQLSECHQKITRQNIQAKRQGFISKAYGGLIDGLYLYMGVAVVVALSPEIFGMVACFSIIFVLTCIVTRLYEEHIEQRHVLASEDRVKLAICGQEYLALCSESRRRDQQPLEKKINEFLAYRHTLHSRLKLSSSEAILNGLKSGLAIYGVISALLFSAYTVTMILSWSFPAVLIPICAVMGMGCLVGFGIDAWWKNSVAIQQQTVLDNALDDKLLQLCKKTDFAEIKQTILEGMDLKPPGASIIPKHSEVLRSGSSGIAKAPKVIEFTLSALQEPDENGRYHDTPLMFFLMVPCTIFYIFTLGLTSYREEFQKKNDLYRFFTPASNVKSVEPIQSPSPSV